MPKEKCNYCGKEYDSELFSTLDNGSPACIHCVEDEEKRNTEKEILKGSQK